jgi:formamidopyrimidine-DNA glycosylase
MPELPEVEVVKKSLDKKIKKLVINDVIVLNKKLRYKIETKK